MMEQKGIEWVGKGGIGTGVGLVLGFLCAEDFF